MGSRPAIGAGSGCERERGTGEERRLALGTGTGADLEDCVGVAGGTIGVELVAVLAALGWRRLASLPEGRSVRVGKTALRVGEED